jgi:hypothetical protein
MESFLESDQSLRHRLHIHEGQVTVRGFERLALGRMEQITLSGRRAESAQRFSDWLTELCPWIHLVALSGSTAYAASKPEDDVDFYLVTRRNRVWITLLFSMVAARFHRMRNPASPQFCFNRILEDDECRQAFRSRQDPLFAREALNLRILKGVPYYGDLLRSATWIEGIFPRLYRQARLATKTPAESLERPGARIWSVANAIAFAVLAPYLALVGLWRNDRLLRAGKLNALFRTVLRRELFAYESRKYDLLRDTYSKVF